MRLLLCQGEVLLLLLLLLHLELLLDLLTRCEALLLQLLLLLELLLLLLQLGWWERQRCGCLGLCLFPRRLDGRSTRRHARLWDSRAQHDLQVWHVGGEAIGFGWPWSQPDAVCHAV
jgi:hypothetical protein